MLTFFQAQLSSLVTGTNKNIKISIIALQRNTSLIDLVIQIMHTVSNVGSTMELYPKDIVQLRRRLAQKAPLPRLSAQYV